MDLRIRNSMFENPRIAISLCFWLLLGACSSQFSTYAWMENITETGIADIKLRKFVSEDEFQAYLLRVRASAKEQGIWWAQSGRLSRFQTLAGTSTESVIAGPCHPDDPNCAGIEEVVVTARASTSSDSSTPMSITNNQEAGVDEGDIIKLLDRFLIILQDGRLFSIDTGQLSGSLRLVDRIDLYLQAKDEIWYDELLVSGNHLVVIGFNWLTETSEIVVLEMNDDGIISHKVTYYVESNDYYSAENYASRIVGGEFVFYSPFVLVDIDFDEQITYPRIRSWSREDGFSDWRNLFGATDLYHPVQGTLTPTIHAITRCSIADFLCESTGIVESEEIEFYVSPSYFYLWAPADLEVYFKSDLPKCSTDRSISDLPGWQAMLYRVPHSGLPTEATPTAGIPKNQFAMEERGDRFYALVSWLPTTCEQEWPYAEEYKFVSIVEKNFSKRPIATKGNSYNSVPNVPGQIAETRFSKDHMLYAGMDASSHWFYWNDSKLPEPTKLTAIPLQKPGEYIQLNLNHSGNRLELLGNYAVINGYSSRDGLDFTLVGLQENPSVVGTTSIPWVRESEGRSHAFNGLLDDSSGSGIFAVPTIDQARFNDLRERKIWLDMPSDLTFISVDPSQNLAGAGHLFATDEPLDNGYLCAVSCEDWYGNARAVFVGERIFAVTGDELIEGEYNAGQLREVYRIRITEPPENTQRN